MSDRALGARQWVTQRAIGGPVGLRRLLERLGPTWVKLGQFLALRPDLVSREYGDELMRLFDQVPPFPWEAARAIIRDDLGAEAEELFEWIDHEPIGAGSVAQTYRARLKDGEEVAVKVQRPGVRARIERDLGRTRLLARLLDLSGVTLVVAPNDIANELSDWMREEIDFRHSLANVTVLYRLARDSEIEKIPRPYPELSGARVLTVEYVSGVPLSAILAARRGRAPERWRQAAAGVDRDELAANLLTATLRQIFSYRFFHADLHPGNLFALDDGRIGYVDFGLCVSWDGTMRNRLLRYLDAVYRGDVEQMYRALTEILLPSEETDLSAFRADFFAESWHWMSQIRASGETRRPGAPDDHSPIAQWMIAVMRAARRNELRVPPGVISIYRALLVSESVSHELEAEADLRSVGRRFFDQLRSDEVRRAFEPEAVKSVVLSSIQLQREAPEQLRQLLADLADGNFAVTVHTFEAPRVNRAWNRRVRLLTSAVMVVGVAALIARPDLPPGVLLTLVVVLLVHYAWIALQWIRLR